MKLNNDVNWLKKKAERERDLSVSAGSLEVPIEETSTASPAPAAPAKAAAYAAPRRVMAASFSSPVEVEQCCAGMTIAFGRVINLCRRNRGLTIETLAKSADLNPEIVIAIEHRIGFVPDPNTIHQLANALGLSADRMMQLAGNTSIFDACIVEKAQVFAALPDPVEELNEQEKEALNELVKLLAE